MRRILPFLFLAVIFSCSEDDLFSGNEGAVVATVVDNNLEPVGKGVTVITDPFTYELQTDDFGQAKFDKIARGRYDVYAVVNGFGSGKSTVDVGAELARIDVKFIHGVIIDPDVIIRTPEENQGFAEGEPIKFHATIGDNTTPAHDLQVKWESDKDGQLLGSVTDANGNVTLTTSTLSKGEHYIKLTVTNDLGIPSKDSVKINTLAPRSLNIVLKQSSNYNVEISWLAPTSSVSKYEVFRSSDTEQDNKIATLDGGATSYIDNVVPFSDSVFYYIKAHNPSGYSSKSNTAGIKGTPVFDVTATYAEIFKEGSLIYLKSNNTLHAIDYQSMTVKSTETFQGTIGYFHIGNNGFGNELYIPNSDGWLYIYDLATIELKESINIGVAVTSVISDNNGLLYTSVSPSPWWEDPLRVYSRSTLNFIDGGGDFDKTRLKLLNSGKEIIEITTSIAPIDMDYYLFDDAGNIIQHGEDSYHGDHPLDPDIYKIAPGKDYLITSNAGAVYAANSTMSYKGSLPRGSDQFSDFEFNSTASVIYAGLSSKKAIYTYAYPSLNKISEIQTKGYPLFMFRDKNKLIVVSSPEPSSYYYSPGKIGIEIHYI